VSAQAGSSNAERKKPRDRRVGPAADLPEEWVVAVRQAKIADEFSHLNTELD
jgi:hypothetical protein